MQRRQFLASLMSLPLLAGLAGTPFAAASAAAQAVDGIDKEAGAEGIELIMVERDGCVYCQQWLDQIGPIYPKTAAGKFAPLRIINIDAPLPDDLTIGAPLIYSPTFIVVRDGEELSRIEGYPGEDFFWGLLERLLQRDAGFVAEG